MKVNFRNILIASAVILAAAGCSKAPVKDGHETDEITFCVSVPETKAMFTPVTFAQKGNRLKIYDFNDEEKYFDDLIGPDVDGNTYGYSGVWPFENAPHAWTVDTHKFFGWLANDASGTPDDTSDDLTPNKIWGDDFSFDETTRVLTIPETVMNQETPQFDFLYSNIITRDMVNNPDYSAVNLEFKHLFTAVSFGAENTYNTDVTIHEFRVERILNSRSATIDYSVDATQPVVTFVDGDSNLNLALEKEYTLKSKDAVSNIFTGEDKQKFVLLWPLSSSYIHSDIEQTEDVQMIDDYRIYIRYSSGTVQDAERRINFPKMNWEAGRMYHFDIVFADKMVTLNFNVNPWEYVQQKIDFSEGTVSANQQLSWNPETYLSTENDRMIFFRTDHKPIEGSFILGTPVGGTWMASLTGDIGAFEIVPDNGIIDGRLVKFVVKSKVDDPKQEFRAKLKFAVRRSDATVVSADVVLMDRDGDGEIEDDQYTIILSRN